MKTSKTILLAALALGVTASLALAQDKPPQGPGGNHPPQQGGGPGGPGGPGQGGPGGPGGQGGQRAVPPIMAALDANHDGIIDEKEIANASAALKSLDKNGDGKLTPDEIRPPRPAGQGGQGGQGQGRPPRGQGGGQGGPGEPAGPPPGQ